MALPAASIEELFARMQIRYAAKFERNYAGMNLAAVKADWAEVLDGLSVKAIQFGLVNLPIEWPPNASEFRAICVQAPHAKPHQDDLLPAPKRNPARLKAELQRLHELLVVRKPLAWAYDLQEQERKGAPLSMYQHIAWREALVLPEAITVGEFRRPMQEELPPGMRTARVDPADVARVEAYVRDLLYGRRREQAERFAEEDQA